MKFLPLYKGKLGETQGRKAKGAKASKRSYASQNAEGYNGSQLEGLCYEKNVSFPLNPPLLLGR
jgi:hypothetical protein